MGWTVDGLRRCEAVSHWPRHVVRVCRSRRVRSLARASKGVMHVWAKPLAAWCFRIHYKGFRRARVRAGALAVVWRLWTYASYWAPSGVILNHVWSKKSWCLERTGFLNLPNHVFSRWWSDEEAVMQPDQGLRRVSCEKCFHGLLNNLRFKVFKQAKCAVTLARTVGRSEPGQQLFSQRFALGP